jgi:transketolase
VRETFIATTTALLEEDPRTALVLADISADAFAGVQRRHPDRVLNVGIREQLMAGVGGGLALTGMRPYLHSYAPFLIDRAYEQIKLDFAHQDVGAVLVSIGASYDAAAEGYTHQSPGDVALLDTLDGWTVHVPGHRDEVAAILRAAARHDDRVYVRLSTQENSRPRLGGGLHVLRPGGPLVVAVGPMLDPVLEATLGLDVTVAYTNTPRPLDTAGLRSAMHTGEIVVVEPYARGTSAHLVSETLSGLPHRALHLGVGRAEVRKYGSRQDHARAHGLDPAGLRRSIEAFLGS